MRKGESGQALIIVLVLLLLVSIISTSLLGLVATSYKTNQTFLNNTSMTYAAESGIQDGIWQILNQSSSDLGLGLLNSESSQSAPKVAYTDYDYNKDGWTYSLTNPQNPAINGYTVGVNVKNIWIPLVDDKNPSWLPTASNLSTHSITPPTPIESYNIINSQVLTIMGGVSNVPHYTVSINYSGATSLIVTSIGVWLPQGFTYNNQSSNLQNSISHAWLYSTEQILDCAGNEAVVWTFPTGTSFSSLLSSMGQFGNTLSIQFDYNTSQQKLPDAQSWITVTPNGSFPYYYTWDADVKVHDLTSTVGNTEVEAIVPKSESRSLGSAMNGDYVTTGASLMIIGNGYTPMNDPDQTGTRKVLLSDSSSSINTIPANSIVEGAYLYWSGWFNYSSMPASTYAPVVNFKINNIQVDFSSQGKPERGVNGVASTRNQWRSNAPTGTGYSYSSYRDVTALVQSELKTETGNSYFPSTVNFDVGASTGWTMGSTGNQWSYADWSLIIIYSGATTLGHQLYLYDTFSYADNNTDIDVTGNTSGVGGVISGFIVPQQLPSEVGDPNSVCAKLTCFVGDGDWCYSGDFIAINAPPSYQTLANIFKVPDSYKLWDGINLPAPTAFKSSGDPALPNSPTQPDNVWNSYNQMGGAADGIDLKTFNILWSSGLIHAGDTSARIDVPTVVDSWNLVYVILSFRSSVTSGGSISYLIRKKTP